MGSGSIYATIYTRNYEEVDADTCNCKIIATITSFANLLLPWKGVIVMKKVLTTCGYCGCGCNLYINVRGNEVIGVTPKSDHPVSQGKLCVKGWQGYSFVNHPDRLKQPLIRQEDGSFKEVDWSTALEYTAEKLNNIIADYGADSIGVLSSARCTNEENYLLSKFARAVLKTSNIDHCARL